MRKFDRKPVLIGGLLGLLIIGPDTLSSALIRFDARQWI